MPWNIKHQVLQKKVLHKLCYSQRDISGTLVEDVFKLIKVQRKTISWNKMSSSFIKVISFSWKKVSEHFFPSKVLLVSENLKIWKIKSKDNNFERFCVSFKQLLLKLLRIVEYGKLERDKYSSVETAPFVRLKIEFKKSGCFQIWEW